MVPVLGCFKIAVDSPGEGTATPASGSLFLPLKGQKTMPAHPAEGFETIQAPDNKTPGIHIPLINIDNALLFMRL